VGRQTAAVVAERAEPRVDRLRRRADNISENAVDDAARSVGNAEQAVLRRETGVNIRTRAARVFGDNRVRHASGVRSERYHSADAEIGRAV
jgi:hypothetical protein